MLYVTTAYRHALRGEMVLKTRQQQRFCPPLAIHMPTKFIPAVSSPHEKTVKRELTNFVSSYFFFFFFFKPAISLLEQVQVIIFPPSVSRVARGVHGHQAIVFLQLHISAVDREVHHSKHKTTPFLFEAGRPGRRVGAHTLRLHKFRKFRS